MRKIVLASQNPVKAKATEEGFRRLFADESFDLTTVSVPSGVADQPLSDIETLRGARNRAQAARALMPEADFWVGMEGGIEDVGTELVAFAWVVIESSQGAGQARSATFSLPPAVSELVRGGLELGEADDRVFGDTNSKHKGGAVGLLTAGAIDRAALYSPAVTLALIPELNPALFSAPPVAAPGGSS